LSKIDAGKVQLCPEYVVVADLIRDKFNIKAISRRKELNFEVNIGRDVPKEVIVDKTRLVQVINNLIGNAIKFTEKEMIDRLTRGSY